MNIDREKVVQFLHDSVDNLVEGTATNNRLILDDRLAIFVGWQDGYSKDDETVIHDENEPTWGIVSGVKVWTSDDMWTDFDYLNFPYYENEEVLSNEVAVSPDEDYESLADYLLNEYEGLKDLCMEEDGKIVPCEEDELEEEFKSVKHIDWQALVDDITEVLKTRPQSDEKQINVWVHTDPSKLSNEAEMYIDYYFPHSDEPDLSDFNGVREEFEIKLTYDPDNDRITIKYYTDPPFEVSSPEELASWIDESI